LQNDNGEVVVNNASSTAIMKAQQAFAGVAESTGNPTKDEIQGCVDEVRYGKGNSE
jgi:hypothetical protein